MSPALLLVDAQMEPVIWRDRGYGWAAPGADAAIARLLAGFRARGLPVIHVHHAEADPASSMHPGAAGFAPQPGAEPRPGEPVFVKSRSSAFSVPGLATHLAAAGIGALVVAGGEGPLCISSTVRSAHDAGLQVTLAADAVITLPAFGADGAAIPADQVQAVELAALANFARLETVEAILSALPPVTA